jgi:hypothetical protein
MEFLVQVLDQEVGTRRKKALSPWGPKPNWSIIKMRA